MTAPTTVWCILQKNSLGKPRGFEKGDGQYYVDYVDARSDFDDDTETRRQSFSVVECVIMSAEEYQNLIQQIPPNKV